jgi:hypothetical protein
VVLSFSSGLISMSWTQSPFLFSLVQDLFNDSFSWCWVHLTLRPIFVQLYQAKVMDDYVYGAVDRMIGRVNRNTRRKPAALPLCPPQIPYDLTWAQSRGATVGSRQLSDWAMAPPIRVPTLAEVFRIFLSALELVAYVKNNTFWGIRNLLFRLIKQRFTWLLAQLIFRS